MIKLVALLLWTLIVPPVTMWVGLYEFKQAFWTCALYHGCYLLPAIFFGRDIWLPSAVCPNRMMWFVLLASMVVSPFVAVGTYEVMGHLLLSNRATIDLLTQIGLTGEWLLVFLLFVTIINPFMEEIYWRGIIFNTLDRWNLPIPGFAIIWSAVAYALFHYWIFRLVLYPGWAEIAIILLACHGAVLALIYRHTRSIIATSLFHAVTTDLPVIGLVLVLFRHQIN